MKNTTTNNIENIKNYLSLNKRIIENYELKDLNLSLVGATENIQEEFHSYEESEQSVDNFSNLQDLIETNEIFFKLALALSKKIGTSEIINEETSLKLNNLCRVIIETNETSKKIRNDFYSLKKEVIIKNIIVWYLKESIDLEFYMSMDDCINNFFDFKEEENEIYMRLKNTKYDSLEKEFLNNKVPRKNRELYFFFDSSRCKNDLGLDHYFQSQFKLDEGMYKIYREYTKLKKQIDEALIKLISTLSETFEKFNLNIGLKTEFDNLLEYTNPYSEENKEILSKTLTNLQDYADDITTYDLVYEISELYN